MSKMLDEIREQPAALERTLHAERKPIEKLRSLLEREKPRLIMLVARGTSDNAAQFGRYLLEITTGIPVSLAAPSIFTLYQAKFNFAGVLVIAISQSGESTDTNLVLERAREQGTRTIGITNEADSTLARSGGARFSGACRPGKKRRGHQNLYGPAAGALSAGARAGRQHRTRRSDAHPEWTQAALGLEPEIARRAERYRFMDHALVVGRGLNYSNAFEFALKLMETCYVVAERFSSADLLHGPIAMVEASFPAFLFAPGGVTWPGIREMIAEARASQGRNAHHQRPE